MFDSGAILLGMFSAEGQRAIIEFVQKSGPATYNEVAKVQSQGVKTDPALGFMDPSVGSDVMMNLARALRVILGDALAGQWTVDKYALALSRSASVPLEFARTQAQNNIVTQDAGIFDFARRLLYIIPDLPGPLDEAARGALGGAIDLLERVLPTAMLNQSQDVLYEWNNMGEVLGKLAIRAQLTKKEVSFEKAADVDLGDFKDAALATIPYLARALMGLMGHKLESGDLMEAGDRDDLRDIFAEAGDLIAESRALTTPEQGTSFFKRLGRWAKKAGSKLAPIGQFLAPLAAGVVGGPAGMLAVGGLEALLRHPHHSSTASSIKEVLNHPATQSAQVAASQYPSSPYPFMDGIESGDIQRYPVTIQSLYQARTYSSNVGPYRQHGRQGSSLPYHDENER